MNIVLFMNLVTVNKWSTKLAILSKSLEEYNVDEQLK